MAQKSKVKERSRRKYKAIREVFRHFPEFYKRSYIHLMNGGY